MHGFVGFFFFFAEIEIVLYPEKKLFTFYVPQDTHKIAFS